MDKLKELLSLGYSIKWVGYHAPLSVYVHLHKLSEREQIIIVPLNKDYTKQSFARLRSSFSDYPRTNVGTIWSSDTRLNLLRLASILGINVGGDARPGPNKSASKYIGCVMAYDIETDRSRIPAASFGTLSESILSIAIYCSCGESKVFSFISGINYDYVLCENSTDTVRKFVAYVSLHSPQWLVGYNNFSYDNSRIMYHAPKELDHIMIPMKVGIKSSRSLACYIDIQGTYNIDLLTFLDKTARSRYPNMSLKTVAASEDISQKMDFDTLNIRNISKLFDYNVQDCKVTMELSLKANIVSMIQSLSIITCAPVIDVDRFASGTFSCTTVASWCLHNRIQMDWSPCSQYIKYEGAHVISPVLGLHENVYSCDFSSMYPTIIMSANISFENCTISKTKRSNGSIWHTDKTTHFAIEGILYSFDKNIKAVLPSVISSQVKERKAIKFKDPVRADALKKSSNSIYGSTGDMNSFIYAPGCSSSITAGGRWCLAVAQSILKSLGYRILAGDTDSNHIVRFNQQETARVTPFESMKILSRIFDFTPFPGMSMEVECLYEKIAYFGKKTYFGSRRDIQSEHNISKSLVIISKGMSRSRKDRLGVCRSISSTVIDIILSNRKIEEKRTIIGNLISYCVDQAIHNNLLLEDVSKIVKRSGENYYEYTGSSGRREYLECDSSTGDESVDYSASVVCKMIKKELKNIVTISRIGSIETMIEMSSDI